MKKLLFLFLLLILFLFPTANAIGVSPSKTSVYFKPNYVGTIELNVDGLGANTVLQTYIQGDLEFNSTVSIASVTDVPGGKKVTINVALPADIEKFTPGYHRVIVGMKETVKDPKQMIALTAVGFPIDIFVPYRGEYAKVTLAAGDIGLNETENFNLNVQNLGTKLISLQPSVEIFRASSQVQGNFSDGDRINTVTGEAQTLDVENLTDIQIPWYSANNGEGIYGARAVIKYSDKVLTDEKIFRIGKLNIEIINFSGEIAANSISPFNLEVQSKWNSPILGIHGSIDLLDGKGLKINTFNTVTFDLNPWERKNVTNYVNTQGLTPGSYLANVTLFYGLQTTSALGTVEIKTKSDYMILVIIAIAIFVIILAVIATILAIKWSKKSKR